MLILCSVVSHERQFLAVVTHVSQGYSQAKQLPDLRYVPVGQVIHRPV